MDTVPNGNYLREQAKLILNKAFPPIKGIDMSSTGARGPLAQFVINSKIFTAKNGKGSSYEGKTRLMLHRLSTTTPFRLHDYSALPESGRLIPFNKAEDMLALHCEKQALAALLYINENNEDNDNIENVDSNSNENFNDNNYKGIDNSKYDKNNNRKHNEINEVNIKVNLCMCSDCHMIFKYASKSYNKRIVCEDPSRKHCFTNGKCSCLDIWPGKYNNNSNSKNYSSCNSINNGYNNGDDSGNNDNNGDDHVYNKLVPVDITTFL